jgi:hypothetical protein
MGKNDTMFKDEVIDAMTDYKIMSDAGVEWEKGVGTDIAKSLGWLLGGWASFGLDKKVKKLKDWAGSESGKLQDEKLWIGVFN